MGILIHPSVLIAYVLLALIAVGIWYFFYRRPQPPLPSILQGGAGSTTPVPGKSQLPSTPTASNPKSAPPQKSFNFKLLAYFGVISFALIVLVGIIMLNVEKESWIKINNLALLTFYAEILYFLASLRFVGPTEIGALLFLGRPLYEVGSGPVFAPIGFFSVIKDTALVIQDQYPEDPENVDKTDTDTLAPGKVFPMRVTHGKAGPQSSSDDPIDDRMTTEVSVIARYRVMRGYYIVMLKTVGSMSEVRRQIRDTVEGETKKQFARRTPSVTLLEMKKIDGRLKAQVRKLTADWGIEIIDVQLIDIDLGKKVNQALRDVPAAKLEKKATVIASEAEEIKVRNIGRGTADARELLLVAKGKGEKQRAELAKTPEGQFALATSSAVEAASFRNFAVVSPNDLVGGILALQGAGKGLNINQPPSPVNPGPATPPTGQPVPSGGGSPRPTPGPPQRTGGGSKKRKP